MHDFVESGGIGKKRKRHRNAYPTCMGVNRAPTTDEGQKEARRRNTKKTRLVKLQGSSKNVLDDKKKGKKKAKLGTPILKL